LDECVLYFIYYILIYYINVLFYIITGLYDNGEANDVFSDDREGRHDVSHPAHISQKKTARVISLNMHVSSYVKQEGNLKAIWVDLEILERLRCEQFALTVGPT